MANATTRYKNTQNAYLPCHPFRESIAPFAITRGYTEKEFDESADLRSHRDRGYLVEFTGDAPANAHIAPAKKAEYIMEPGSGDAKTITKKTGTGTVEFVTAVEEGVDSVGNADPEIIATMKGKKPVDYIEKGHVAPDPMKVTKPEVKYQSVSEAAEAELLKETTEDMDFDDEGTLAELDADRDETPDADEEIAKDHLEMINRNRPSEAAYSQEDNETKIIRSQGNMGAEETTVKEAVTTDVAKANHQLEEALKPNLDEGEKVSSASPEANELLGQTFDEKKWAISKSDDTDLLTEVKKATGSENVKNLAQSRLDEIASAE